MSDRKQYSKHLRTKTHKTTIRTKSRVMPPRDAHLKCYLKRRARGGMTLMLKC